MRNKVMGIALGGLGCMLALAATAAAQPADPEEAEMDEEAAQPDPGEMPGPSPTFARPSVGPELTLAPRRIRAVTTSCPAVRARMKEFVDDHCKWAPRQSTCRVYRTGNYYAQASGTSALCRVDHISGNGLTIYTYVGGSLTDTDFHPPGHEISYALSGGGSGTQQRRIQISNASGDRYSIACRWF